MKNRQPQILKILNEKRRVTTTELSAALGVTEVTVRKDLSKLEDRGLLRREHGYTTLANSDDVINRLAFNYEIKQKIAKKVLDSIKNGETLMIESGSCCALLAEEIVTGKSDVTIITNSAFIASFVRKKSGARIIILGGEYQNESQVMVGPLVKTCAKNFHVDKFFIGTDGFDENGAMSGDLMRAEAVCSMAESADRVIILTESKKFLQTGTVALLPYKKISAVYTDSEIENSTRQNLERKNIKIYTA